MITSIIPRQTTRVQDSERTERRKFDRIYMGHTVHTMAKGAGFDSKLTETGRGRQHRVVVEIIATRGLTLVVDFDSQSIQPDIFVLSWHSQPYSDFRIAEAFALGNVNPHHRRKATHVAQGWPELRRILGVAFERIVDGSAFEKDPAPRRAPTAPAAPAPKRPAYVAGSIATRFAPGVNLPPGYGA